MDVNHIQKKDCQPHQEISKNCQPKLGKDIAERQAENVYGSKFYAILSKDLKRELPNVEGLSESNIRYCKRFYLLYKDAIENLPQLVEKSDGWNLPQVVEKLCSIPWGHHRLIIDRCSDSLQKALFFVDQTLENGWSRAMLLNWIDTGLYERSGKVLTNFKNYIIKKVPSLSDN